MATKLADKPNTLAAALVAAQSELSAPVKNRTVTVRSDKGNYKFDYATLDGIVEQVLRPVLPRFGLWFVQFVADGQMVTRIVHEAGETMDCGIPMPNLPAKAQEAGSLISYFKRYSLCAAFGLVAEEDDDGNAASGNSFDAQQKNAAARSNGKIDETQYATLTTMIEKYGADTKRFLKYFGVETVNALPAAKFKEAVDSLNEFHRAKLAKQKEAA